MDYKNSGECKEPKASLPEELRGVCDKFVADFRHAATPRYGKPYVSYIVLADMVKAGWRCTAKEF